MTAEFGHHRAEEVLLAQYPIPVGGGCVQRVVERRRAVQVVDPGMERVPGTGARLQHADIHAAESVDHFRGVAEVHLRIVVDLHVGQLLDRPHQQGRAAGRERALELHRSFPGHLDHDPRRYRHHGARVLPGVDVQQHDEPAELSLRHGGRPTGAPESGASDQDRLADTGWRQPPDIDPRHAADQVVHDQEAGRGGGADQHQDSQAGQHGVTSAARLALDRRLLLDNGGCARSSGLCGTARVIPAGRASHPLCPPVSVRCLIGLAGRI